MSLALVKIIVEILVALIFVIILAEIFMDDIRRR